MMRAFTDNVHQRRLRYRFLIKVLTLTLTAITSSGIEPSNAMPPHPDLMARIERGEIPMPMPLAQRDELLRNGVDAPGPRLRPTAAATTSFRALAILVQFSDVPAQAPAASFDTLLFELGQGSVRDYYSEISYGKLDMVTVNLPSAVGWQTAPESRTFYANGQYGLWSTSYPNNARRLVEDAVAAADSLVDFSLYDNDGNGWVDALMVIHTGPGGELSGDPDDIWSHKWSISRQLRDGVWVYGYAMMPEYWRDPGDMTIGVFAHELGHVFGLPDLYDTDYSSRGVGRWSLMAGGSWNGSLGSSPAHPDAWSRIQLGFTSPITPTTGAFGVPLPQVEADTVIYRLWDGGLPGSEYFLVENRQKTGFDAGLPGSGLLIWHIDDTVSTKNTREWYPGYTDSGHCLVALEQADGNWEMEQGINSGNSGDPFPGSTDNRTFNSTTTPNSLAYDGSVSLVTVSNISSSGPTMTADLSVSLVLGIGDDGVLPNEPGSVHNYPNPFNASTRIRAALPAAGVVTVGIYNVLGERVRVLTSPGVVVGTWEADWDGRDEAGRTLSSGVYWYRVVGGGIRATGRMLMLK